METWEQKIRSRYYDTYRQMRKELEDDIQDIKDKDDEYLKELKAGKINRHQFYAWRMRVNLYLQKKTKELAEMLNKADEDAMQAINQAMPKRYEKAYDTEGYEIEKSLNVETNFDLINTEAVQRAMRGKFMARYDSIANTHYNRRRVASVITAATLQGSTISDIAKWLLPLCNNNKKSAIRNGRTFMTGVENGGRHDAALKMKELGVHERKIWLAVTDMLTRLSHRALDEEVKEVDEPFSNGGMYPADPKLPAAERYNCRCRYRILPDGFNPDMSVRHVNIGGMTYEEWKNMKVKKRAVKAQQPAPQSASKSTLTPEQLKAYNALKKSCVTDNIAHNDVQPLVGVDRAGVIARLAGGDKTTGSCASLMLCYAAGVHGIDVLDFRGGISQKTFSRDINIVDMLKSAQAKYQVTQVTTETKGAAQVLSGIEDGKEYYLGAGQHAAVVRKNNGVLQYLEMQSPTVNGWRDFEYTKTVQRWDSRSQSLVTSTQKVTVQDTLHYRFGCAKSQRSFYGMKYKSNVYLAEIDSFVMTDEFKDLMGYINTKPNDQKKGKSGVIR